LKICIVEDGRILAFLCREMKGSFNSLYRELFHEALEHASRERGTRISRRLVKRIVSTGYGSHLVKRVTRGLNESLCTARGAWEQNNNIKTVIAAGGFFIRVIAVGRNGHPLHCLGNENCAAGSGSSWR
jgi:activator of 2-hydroxyglutaryl-CoA dehydratase